MTRDAAADSAATLNDAYKYMLSLMTVDPSEAMRIQSAYGDDKLRDLFAAVAGISIGVFGNLSADVRKQMEAPIRYALTGDKSVLDILKDTGKAATMPEPVPGQYL